MLLFVETLINNLSNIPQLFHQSKPWGKALTVAALLLCAPISPTMADRQQAAAYYEEALIYNNQDKAEEAIIQLKNALQQDATLLSARVLLGTIYMENGELSAAEKELREAETLGADRTLTAIPLAKAYLKQHKYAALIAELPLEDYPRSVHGELLTYRGHAHLEIPNLEEAEKSFKQAAELLPDSTAPINGMALLSLRSGDAQAAMSHIERSLHIEPDNIETLNIMASTFHAAGDLRRAIESYSAVLQRDSKHMESRLARAGVYTDLRELDKAMIDLDFMENNYPMEPRAIYLKSLIYSFQNKPQESKEALQKTATIIDQLRPEFLSRSRQHLMLAGLTYYALGNLEQAQTHLNNLLQITPNALGPIKLLASVYTAQSDYDDVIRLLQPVVDRAQVHDYKILTLLGKAYTQIGRYDKAEILLEKAIAISQRDNEPQLSLAINYYSAGEANKAVTELSAVFEMNSDEIAAGAALAAIYLKQNKPLKALDVLEQIISNDPDNITYNNLIGTAQVMSKQFDAALATFEKIEAIAPESIPVQINLARLDNLTNNSDRARDRLRNLLLNKDAPTGHIMLELAKTEDVAGNRNEAIRWAEKVRAEERNNLEARLYLIDIYRRNNELDNALEITHEANRLDPENLEFLQIEAQIYIALNNTRAARTSLNEMSSLAGFDPLWLFRIARLQYEIQAYKEAEYSLKKAIQEDPNFIDAQVALIEILTGLNKLDEAEERIHSLQSNPDFKAKDRLLGDIAIRRGDNNKALFHYQAAMQQTPTSQLNIKLYQAYSAAGQWHKATELLNNWLKNHPQDLDSQLALAEAYLRQGKHQQAIFEYEAVLKHRPESSSITSNLAFLYLITGNDKALATARKAYQLAPQDAAVNDTLGWILVKQGEPEQGLPYLRDAHSRSSNDPEIRYHIAVALFELGRHNEAFIELEQSLSTPHSFEGMEHALELRDQLAANQGKR